jgi:hypothetical protein
MSMNPGYTFWSTSPQRKAALLWDTSASAFADWTAAEAFSFQVRWVPHGR